MTLRGKTTWYLNISQVKDMELLRKEVRTFLNCAARKEPKIIHEIKYVNQ